MKQLCLLPLFCLSAAALSAQTIHAGVKAGFQVTNTTHVSDAKAALQYHAGVYAQAPLDHKLTVQAELLMSAHGLNDEDSDVYRQRNLYLTLPVLAKYPVWDRLSVHAGLQAGMLLSAKLKISDEDYKGSYGNKEDYKKAGLDFLLGAEYGVSEHIGVGMRMNWGISEVYVDYARSRQRVFQVFAVYQLM